MPLKFLGDMLGSDAQAINNTLAGILEDMPVSCRPVIAHILKSGGKRLRPLLTLLCSGLFSGQKASFLPLAASMEMLHAATLLHDDIIDNAHSRRGKPAAHKIFGITRAILSGDALLASGNALVARYGMPELSLGYSHATSQTAAGEILELESLRNPELSYEAYLEIAKGKTACLISQSCRMGALAAKAADREAEACAAYGENLGIAYQLVDDALDLAPESETGKPSGGDLREGKMTPPLMFYRQSLPDDAKARFDRQFRNSAFTPEELDRIIQDAQPFAMQTRKLADAFLGSAIDALSILPDKPEKNILSQLASYVGVRSN